MSSIVAVHGYQGFVISTDSIVFKHILDASGAQTGKVKGITRKLFQIHDDILVAGLGNWGAYFPIFNHVAGMQASKEKILDEVRKHSAEPKDTRVYIFHRESNDVVLDIVENQEIKLNVSGAVMYPEPLLNSLFLAMYENEAAVKIRSSGLLGMAALVHAYNAFALSLCSDIAAPFDTILFKHDGIFNFSGGVTRLPVGDFV
jgi:hypothetical protein